MVVFSTGIIIMWLLVIAISYVLYYRKVLKLVPMALAFIITWLFLFVMNHQVPRAPLVMLLFMAVIAGQYIVGGHRAEKHIAMLLAVGAYTLMLYTNGALNLAGLV
jgi:hypothetical protein